MILLAKKKKLMGVQQNLIYCDNDTKAIITFLCEQSNSLYNCGVYWARQLFFKTGKIISKFAPIYEIGSNIHAQAMPSVAAQQTLLSVSENFDSFKKLREAFFAGKLDGKPKAPNYRESGGLFKVAFPNVGAGKPTFTNDGLIRFPLGLTINRWFKVKEFFLALPTNIDFKKVKEFTILPKNGAFYLECSYLVEKKMPSKAQSEPVRVLSQADFALDVNQALSIDLGTSANLMAGVDTLGNSLLIDSKQAKAMNQLYNKKVAQRKQGRERDYWDNFLDFVTRRRNNQMRDMINKAAKLAINHCLKYRIGTIVIGWNIGMKTSSNMGKRNNQQFVQIPLAKLKKRIEQLAEIHGIRFVETEEAYTSKSSFLDGDSLPKFGQKPDGWKASGKRELRGLYKSADGSLINADLNGAANILKKVARNLGLDLSRLCRRCLTTVGRIRLWKTKFHSNSKESPWL